MPAQFAALIAKRNERLTRVRPQRTEPIPVELDGVLQEIEKALAAKLYYLAIAVALSVPDICACLEFDPDNPSRANRKTYADWCNNNIRGMPRLTGDDLYNLRGGALHKGHFGHEKSQFNRVIFIGPESAIKMHGTLISGEMRLGPHAEIWKGPILCLGVAEFCETIVDFSTRLGACREGRSFRAAKSPNVSALPAGRPSAIFKGRSYSRLRFANETLRCI